MGIIVAIGGGEIKDLETFEIDKVIVGLTGKKQPKALFIPTASNDAEGYCDIFHEVYGTKLGCNTDVLYLINRKPTENQIKEKILNSDLIYVGGGNTLKMLEIWKENNVDKFLKEAWDKDIVLSGLSAGSICWFKYGHSDSQAFSRKGEWSYIKVNGLGFIDAFHCPHFNEDMRKENFKKMLKSYSNTKGIALENNSAIIIVNDKYRIISSIKEANAFKIFNKDEEIVSEVIKEDIKFNNLEELLS